MLTPRNFATLLFPLLSLPLSGWASENLLKNPGFENEADTTSWSENNWAKLPAEYVRDPVNPHSGKFSQRMNLLEAKGGTDLLLAQKVEALPGDSIRVSVWLRGQTNSAPIQVKLRKRSAPYSIYFAAEIMVTDAWAEHVFNLTLPPSTDGNDLALFVGLRDQTTLWVDDVSITKLPEKEPGAPLVGNPIRNSSFEVGRDGWVATFREKAGPASAGKADENNIGADQESVLIDDAPDGRRVLKFKVRDYCSAAITTGYFPLHYGHPVKIGFWMRTNVPGIALTARLGGGSFPNMSWEEATFKSESRDWRYYSFIAKPKPNPAGTYILELASTATGEYEIDKVSITDPEAGPAISSYASLEAGFQRLPDSDPANIFFLNQEAKFLLNVRSKQAATLSAKVIDPWGKILKEFPIDVPASPEERTEIPVILPTAEFGGFKCSVYTPGEALPVAELLYTVLPKLKPPGEVADSFFGGHVALTPYNLHIAAKAGFRWLRLFPPLVTQWMAVEPEKGRWQFETRGVQRAKDLGFKMTAGFSTTPAFYADATPEQAAKATWHHSYPPKDWNAWQDYVVKTQKAFASYIDYWEIWNEPDGGFLQVPVGQKRAEVYLKLVKTAREALTKVGADPQLIGGATTSLHRSFTREVLEAGAGDYLDLYSFHYYDGCVSETSPEEMEVPEQMKFVNSFKNRNGKPMEMWVTESGITGPSWLEGFRIPPADPNTVGSYTTTTVRTAVAFKALGIKKFFHYDGIARSSGTIAYRRLTEITDTDGIPQPALAAFATMVYFLDETEVVSLDTLPVGDAKVILARFTRDGQPIEVVWSRKPTQLGKIPGLNLGEWDVFDVMGNPLAATAETEISLKPLYLRKKTPGSP